MAFGKKTLTEGSKCYSIEMGQGILNLGKMLFRHSGESMLTTIKYLKHDLGARVLQSMEL